MHIVLFTHPAFQGSLSMPRFAEMIREGMRERGHALEVWAPKARFFRMPALAGARKWLGYVDQFLVFPLEVRRRLGRMPHDTLFVFADQALGPWVPLVAHRPHVIHCHDFLAQRSALGEIPQNPTRWSGCHYQAYIRRGFRCGQNFISISKATQDDLHRLLGCVPPISNVVYNGLNGDFRPIEPKDALNEQPPEWREALHEGCILHVGGSQWYKNRAGVVDAYRAYAKSVEEHTGDQRRVLPLVLVGDPVGADLLGAIRALPESARVLTAVGISFTQLRALYSLGKLLFFPSLAEGFGWPIAEAQACGCPVITTDAAPMTEVAGGAAELIPAMPVEKGARAAWAAAAGQEIAEVLAWPPDVRATKVAAGIENARRFDPVKTLDAYARIYEQVGHPFTREK